MLVQALEPAEPVTDTLIDERFDHLPPAEAALEALGAVAAQPPNQGETGVQHLAERLQAPASVLRRP